MTAALLAFTALLVTVATALYVVSFRGADPLSALAGMMVMIAAAIPAVVYASLSG